MEESAQPSAHAISSNGACSNGQQPTKPTPTRTTWVSGRWLAEACGQPRMRIVHAGGGEAEEPEVDEDGEQVYDDVEIIDGRYRVYCPRHRPHRLSFNSIGVRDFQCEGAESSESCVARLAQVLDLTPADLLASEPPPPARRIRLDSDPAAPPAYTDDDAMLERIDGQNVLALTAEEQLKVLARITPNNRHGAGHARQYRLFLARVCEAPSLEHASLLQRAAQWVKPNGTTTNLFPGRTLPEMRRHLKLMRTRPSAQSAAPLADVEPWPEPITDGAALLDEIVTTITRYLRMGEHAAEALALWIVQSHAIDAFDIAAILLLWSPIWRCGKSRTLEIAGQLVRRPLTTSNITGASTYRVVEKYSPTILADEAETFLAVRKNGANDELRGIINSGHTRGTAQVLRCEGDDHEPRTYSTFCMKMLAFNGKPNVLGHTIADRGIAVMMKRKDPGDRVEKLRRARFAETFDPLKRKIARWATDHLEDFKGRDPAVPPTLDDRAADNWTALLAIADVAGGHWPETARAAAVALSDASERTDDSRGVELLADIRAIFNTAHNDGDLRLNRYRAAATIARGRTRVAGKGSTAANSRNNWSRSEFGRGRSGSTTTRPRRATPERRLSMRGGAICPSPGPPCPTRHPPFQP